VVATATHLPFNYDPLLGPRIVNAAVVRARIVHECPGPSVNWVLLGMAVGLVKWVKQVKRTSQPGNLRDSCLKVLLLKR